MSALLLVLLPLIITAPSSTAGLLDKLDSATPAGSGWRSKVLPQHLRALLTLHRQQQHLFGKFALPQRNVGGRS